MKKFFPENGIVNIITTYISAHPVLTGIMLNISKLVCMCHHEFFVVGFFWDFSKFSLAQSDLNHSAACKYVMFLLFSIE